MTAEVLDQFSVGTWFQPRPNARITIAPRADEEPQAATLPREGEYSRRVGVVLRLVDVANRSPYFQPMAVVHLASWLASLPMALPDPFIAIGDDGSISSEWDVAGNSLHVTFYSDSSEAYFSTPSGYSWEGSVGAIDRISAALRVITLAALG